MNKPEKNLDALSPTQRIYFMSRNRCALLTHKVIDSKYLLVEDQDITGYPTLTNSIEEAMEQLKKEGINYTKYKVIQKDSEGLYSLVKFENGNPRWKYLGASLNEALTNVEEN